MSSNLFRPSLLGVLINLQASVFSVKLRAPAGQRWPLAPPVGCGTMQLPPYRGPSGSSPGPLTVYHYLACSLDGVTTKIPLLQEFSTKGYFSKANPWTAPMNFTLNLTKSSGVSHPSLALSVVSWSLRLLLKPFGKF